MPPPVSVCVQAASRTGCRLAVLVGHDELARGAVAVKDMWTGAQVALPVDAARVGDAAFVRDLACVVAERGWGW